MIGNQQITKVSLPCEQLPDRDADTVIKAICLTLIVAATDTTAVTLTWAIALLLNNPDVLKKAQDELDIQVGTERQVNESDEEFGLLAGHYQGNNAFIPCWTTFTTSRVYRRMHRKGLWLTGGSMSPYGRALFMMLHTSQKLNSAEKWDGLMASRAKMNSPPLETMMSTMQKEGYVASRSHIASNSIKTNCPMVVCIRIAKELQGCQKT
ncbi:hypothetical protein CUMW_053090 [Citrus unshiu]|nr:hypothetical protein CUMW_053090 [Citrus unshiu]